MALDWGITGDLYVAKDGDDANIGTQAAPKATIQGAIDAASSGGTIIVASGQYDESPSASKTLTFYADGHVVVTGTMQPGSADGYYTFYVHGFRFVPSGTALTAANRYTKVYAYDCVFVGCTVGMHCTQNGVAYAENCVFDSCTTGMESVNNELTLQSERCTFVDCSTGATTGASGDYSNVTHTHRNSIFYNCGRHVYGKTSQSGTLDYCNFYVVDSTHDIVWKGVTYTTHSALQAAGWNTHGVSQAVSFADTAIDDYGIAPDDEMLVLGANHSRMGAVGGVLTLSPNKNATTWNAPENQTNVEQDANGYWVLTNAGSGTMEFVSDFGGPVYVHEVEFIGTITPPGAVFDDATGDHFWGYEYKSSLVSAADRDAQAWTAKKWRESLGITARYMRVRPTLRTDGDL